VSNADHKSPRYVAFSKHLSPPPFYAYIVSSIPYSRTPSAYVPPAREQASHPNKTTCKITAHCNFILIILVANVSQKILHQMIVLIPWL